jgi:hypothetical protein
VEIDNLLLFHLAHLAALSASYVSWQQILSSDPLRFISILIQILLAPVFFILFIVALPVFGPALSLLLS